MARIPTPAPESTVERLKQTLGGRPADIVWAIFVTLVLTGIGVGLVLAGGALGAAVGAVAIATIYNDAIREAVIDVYARDFWVWRTDR